MNALYLKSTSVSFEYKETVLCGSIKGENGLIALNRLPLIALAPNLAFQFPALVAWAGLIPNAFPEFCVYGVPARAGANLIISVSVMKPTVPDRKRNYKYKESKSHKCTKPFE